MDLLTQPGLLGDGGATKARLGLPSDVPNPANSSSDCIDSPRCRYAQDIREVERSRLRETGPGHFAACDFLETWNLAGVTA